jgi:hypothetical protein
MKSIFSLIALASASLSQTALASDSFGWVRSVSYSVTDGISEGGVPVTDTRHDVKTDSDGPFQSSVTLNQDISSVEGSSAGTETHVKAISSFAKMGVAISGATFANAAGYSAITSAQATSTFSDTLIFESDGTTAPGHFTFHYRLMLDGTATANAVGAYTPNYPYKNNDYVDSGADVSLILSGTGVSGGAVLLSRVSALYANTSYEPPFDVTAPRFIDCAIDMTDDVPMDIFQTMTIVGNASTANFDSVYRRAGSASFDGNFSHTLTWLPGAYFTDAAGHKVTDFTLSSASGFDYLNPGTAAVPEPMAWVLMIGGFGLIGSVGRRRSVRAGLA